MAVPSDSPNAMAMIASSQAIDGIFVLTPSLLCSITAVGGVILKATTKATRTAAASSSISGMTIAAPLRLRSFAMRSTLPAPTNPPTDQRAWNELMMGRLRAPSTWTPTAFMATSMLPLPRPSSTAPMTETGKLVAKANVVAAAMRIARPVSATWRAPIESDSRPPICIATMPARPAVKSRIAISAAVMSNRSPMEGRAPP